MAEEMLIKEQSPLADNVTVIRNRAPRNEVKVKKKKVAAYCRVSTDMEIQETSLETQKAAYAETIGEHPDWELVEIYAEKGLSGTGTAKRVEFQRMVADCKAGKIDIILIKSVSRLARNTVDMLETVRTLKDCGTSIIFEKEHIDTGSLSSELLLAVFAAFAQEESRSISMNMVTNIRKRYSMGKPKWTRVYGFKKAERNVWVVNEDEAKNVRKIFSLYYEGSTEPEIADYFNMKGIESPGKTTWNAATVSTILKNEKYIGDFLMQKTFTTDHLTHKRSKNSDAKVPQYYKKNDHESIVDTFIFNEVRNIQAMRRTDWGILQYPYYGFLRCPYCGEPMVKQRLTKRYGCGWFCGGTGEATVQKERSKCKPFIFMESYLDVSVIDAINHLDDKRPGIDLGFARDIRKVQKLLKNRGKVEYFYLKLLVDNITFPDWNLIKITWKDGTSDTMRITFDKPSDIPAPHIIQIGGESFINGTPIHPAGVKAVEKCIAKKEELVRNSVIIPPKKGSVIQVPRVEKIEEV